MAKNTNKPEEKKPIEEEQVQAPTEAPAEEVPAEAPKYDPWTDMVELTTDYPVPGDEDEGEPVMINGHNYLLPRGETLMVPKPVAIEYNRSRQAKADCYKKYMSKQAEAAAHNKDQDSMISCGL